MLFCITVFKFLVFFTLWPALFYKIDSISNKYREKSQQCGGKKTVSTIKGFNTHTSLNGLIFVCIINGNLHSSQELVSEAVNHCCKHV